MAKAACIRIFAGFLCCGVLSLSVTAQDTDEDSSSVQFNRMERSAIILPVTFSSNAVVGSPWYSPVWIPGQVIFSDGHSLPLPGDILYLNYDKSVNRLYYKNGDSVKLYPAASLSGFRLDDSAGVHTFVKVPRLSSSAWFEVLVEPGNGFSLYKRAQSRLRPPDYETVGYTSVGSKSRRYIDASLYYLLFPDGKKNRRFSLTNSGLRRELARINAKAEHFMELHPGAVSHDLLISLCDELNDSGPPVQSGLPAKSQVPTVE